MKSYFGYFNAAGRLIVETLAQSPQPVSASEIYTALEKQQLHGGLGQHSSVADVITMLIERDYIKPVSKRENRFKITKAGKAVADSRFELISV